MLTPQTSNNGAQPKKVQTQQPKKHSNQGQQRAVRTSHPVNELSENIIAIPNRKKEMQLGIKDGHLTNALSLVSFNKRELCFALMFRDIVGPKESTPRHLKVKSWKKAFFADGQPVAKAKMRTSQKRMVRKKRKANWTKKIKTGFDAVCVEGEDSHGDCINDKVEFKGRYANVATKQKVTYVQSPGEVCVRNHGVTAQTKSITLTLVGTKRHDFTWQFEDKMTTSSGQ